MANVEFTKASLREAIIKAGDAAVEQAHYNLTEATDPAVLADRRTQWREECGRLIVDLSDRVKDGSLTNDEIAEFALPSKPSQAGEHAVRRLREKIEYAEDRRERMLVRVEAMTSDTISLTPKQLTDYFNL